VAYLADETGYAWAAAINNACLTREIACSTAQAAPLPISRFELIAEQSIDLPPHLVRLFSILLSAVHSTENIGLPVLMPLWAEEAMHRAYAMLRLLFRQAGWELRRGRNEFTNSMEVVLARSLATGYRSLASVPENKVVPCAEPLREILLNLGALFAHCSGIVVQMTIEEIRLPAYKRRALVLAASELMINSITHGFNDGCTNRRIEISLVLLAKKCACLRVADNGVGFDHGHPDVTRSISGALADLMEAELRYYPSAEWTTMAEILFPA
jgi:two-component sensor histidine kinase